MTDPEDYSPPSVWCAPLDVPDPVAAAVGGLVDAAYAGWLGKWSIADSR